MYVHISSVAYHAHACVQKTHKNEGLFVFFSVWDLSK